MKNTAKILIIIVCFLLYYAGSTQFKLTMGAIDEYIHYGLLSYFITYVLIGIPIFVGAYLVNISGNAFSNLGLRSNIVTALIATLIFTAPMFIGGLLFYPIGTVTSVPNLIAKTFFAGLFEELYFRGFLFGLLFRYTKLGFIPSILLGAIVFATGHLYQSDNAGIQLGIFLTTFIGSAYFAWLYSEWKFNLWIPILLHSFMNLAWLMFDMSDNAAGNLYANILRGLTIAVSIIITLWYKHKQKGTLAINKSTLWIKK
ncbi:MAG: CPBP family intramembrane glutamic endopeptidase [Flavipsychrobacter sp.]